MGILINPRWEKFSQERARGTSRRQAWLLAGFSPKAVNGSVALDKRPQIVQRVGELIEKRYIIDDMSTKQALERAGVTKFDIIMELKAIGYARMDHFISMDANDQPFLDLAKLSEKPDSWAAVQEVIVEEYVEGHGDDARDVKRTRIKLHDKQAALNKLGAMHNMVDTRNLSVGVAVQVVLTEDELRA